MPARFAMFEETPDLSDRSTLQVLDGLLNAAPPSVALDALRAAAMQACTEGRLKDAFRYLGAMDGHLRHVRSMEFELDGMEGC